MKLLLIFFASAAFSFAAEMTPNRAVQGLAAKYPGDAGIARDPHVLFAENFEDGGIEQIATRWSEMSDKDGKVIALSDDVPPESQGKHSLEMTATLGRNTGGHLYRKLDRGVEKIFARFYVKFPS